MARAEKKEIEPTFEEVTLTIENQEEFDVLIALLGNTNARTDTGLPKHMRGSIYAPSECTEGHVQAQFNLYNALIDHYRDAP